MLDLFMILFLVMIVIFGVTCGAAFLGLALLYKLGLAGCILAVLVLWLVFRN